SINGARLILLTSLGRRGSEPCEAGIAATLTKPVRQSQLFDCLVTVMDGGTRSAEPTWHGSPHFGGALDERASRAPAALPPTEAPTSVGPRILIAEDNPVNQKVALRLAQRLGYRAELVSNGREALEALQSGSYAAVLMDCQMPDMDG